MLYPPTDNRKKAKLMENFSLSLLDDSRKYLRVNVTVSAIKSYFDGAVGSIFCGGL
jgi:hypothetical protein